jgi:hypothetical protein
VAYVAELGYLDGNDHTMVDGDRIIHSIEGMERACFQETNRLVRIHMLGGVAGGRSNAAPMPMVWFCPIFAIAVIRFAGVYQSIS